MVFDHIGFNVSDFAASKRFELIREGDGWAVVGRRGEGFLWFGSMGNAPKPIHVAFAATSRQQVRDFYNAALAAGGKDNGAPGLRPHYHPDYYGAFVIGPDGHNIETVCRAPES